MQVWTNLQMSGLVQGFFVYTSVCFWHKADIQKAKVDKKFTVKVVAI